MSYGGGGWNGVDGGQGWAEGHRSRLIRLGSGLIRIEIRFVHTTVCAFYYFSFAEKEDTWDKPPSQLEI